MWSICADCSPDQTVHAQSDMDLIGPIIESLNITEYTTV